MVDKRRIAKMFGVLVLGGSMLAKAEETPAPSIPPGKSSTNTDNSLPPTKADGQTSSVPKQRVPPPTQTTPQFPNAKEICQVELTLHKYSRDGVKPITTCLDGKSGEEIMKLIEKAKQQTCESPFCGCWLG